MKQTTIMVFGLALVALPAWANPNCLEVGQVWSWKPLDKHTLVVEDELHHKFRIGLQGYCPALPYKLNLGFQSVGGISGLECLQKGDQVISHDVGIRYTCPIMSIAPYTPAMEKADSAAAASKRQ